MASSLSGAWQRVRGHGLRQAIGALLFGTYTAILWRIYPESKFWPDAHNFQRRQWIEGCLWCAAGPPLRGWAGAWRYLHICHKLTQRPSRPMPARGFAGRQAPCAFPPSVYYSCCCVEKCGAVRLTVSHTCNIGRVGDLASGDQVCAAANARLLCVRRGAIAAVSLNASCLGNIGKKSFERGLGTFVGGWLGFLVALARIHKLRGPVRRPVLVLHTCPPGRHGHDCTAVVGT